MDTHTKSSECVASEEISEPGSCIPLPVSMKKAPSTGDVCDQSDEPQWERSQSAANLSIAHPTCPDLSDDDDRGGQANLISEQARVYWNLPEAVLVEEKDETDSAKQHPDDKNDLNDNNSADPEGKVWSAANSAAAAANVGFRSALETIRQREELKEFSTSTECLVSASSLPFDQLMTGRDSASDGAAHRFCPNGDKNGTKADYNMSKSCSRLSSMRVPHHPCARRLGHGASNSLDRLDRTVTDDCGMSQGSSSISMTTDPSSTNQQHSPQMNGSADNVLHQAGMQEGGSYFCESDFDDTREQRPNYVARIRAMEEAMSFQLNRLLRAAESLTLVTCSDSGLAEGGLGTKRVAWMEKVDEQCQAVEECIRLLYSAWETPLYGRDCATALCDLLRRDGGLTFLASRLLALLASWQHRGGLSCVPRPSSSLDVVLEGSVVAEEDATTPTRESCAQSEQASHKMSEPEDLLSPGTEEDNKLIADSVSALERRLILGFSELFSQLLTQENLDELTSAPLPVSDALWWTPLHADNDQGMVQPHWGHHQTLGGGRMRGGASIVAELASLSWKVREDREMSRFFVAILQGLLKHRESTCRLVVAHGGLRALIFACRSDDPSLLRHAAIALANLALYGGAENQSEMVKAGVADWLFPLAFHFDDVIQYYACLAIVVLSSNRELAQGVDASGTLKLVLPFIRAHSPTEFARCEPSHLQGRSSGWLKRLLPALLSEREEARSLAAFHFAMEARIKREQRKTQIFHDIGAVDLLRRVASYPHYLASSLAAQALECIGEEVPYKLSSQVPLWTETDVQYWLVRSGFKELSTLFANVHVDGDILLRLTDHALKEDLEISNGIIRKRLLRELKKLKLTASYRSVDATQLDKWLRGQVGDQFAQYTYGLLAAGVDRPFLPRLSEEMLQVDCGVDNGVHRAQILQAIQACGLEQQRMLTSFDSSSSLPRQHQQQETQHNESGSGQHANLIHGSMPSITTPENSPLPASPAPAPQLSMTTTPSMQKLAIAAAVTSNAGYSGTLASLSTSLASVANRSLDAFISYRRSSGSQLASLLKVHLQLRGYRVFLDIERLAAGKFDESLLRSIRQARNFILVLTPDSLDRCQHDDDQKDWIHKEIVCALDSQCNIIPVTDRFEWPSGDTLPEDMRPVIYYNSVKWIHDYQDACVEKVEKFMRKQCESSPFSPPRPFRPLLGSPAFSTRLSPALQSQLSCQRCSCSKTSGSSPLATCCWCGVRSPAMGGEESAGLLRTQYSCVSNRSRLSVTPPTRRITE